MPNQLKAILFSIFGLVFGGSFIVQWIATGSIFEGLYFVCQLILLIIGILFSFAILFWVGTKIYHD